MLQTKLKNVNIVSCASMSSPATVIREIPVTPKHAKQVIKSRHEIMDILDHKDDRFLVIVGPCSIHDKKDGVEYARRLKKLSDKVSDKILIVMRAYFEKPRTILGWKGMIYDPHLNKSNDIERGIRKAREMLREIVDLGLPVATEILEPIIPQYIADLVSWAAIGARTAESQPHRQMASGLSMPIGIKNATDGSLNVAIEAIRSANAPHSFIGLNSAGHVAVFSTCGNAYGHIVLRGGKTGPNYGKEHIAFAKEVMEKNHVKSNIIVDCSHANSNKDPRRQPIVAEEVLDQRINNGETDIVGIMIESNIKEGRQEIPENLCELTPGLSITDACISWEETESAILHMWERLSQIK